MKFTETQIPGAYLIDIEPAEDERGFFARSYCRKEFLAHGLSFEIVQSNISFNKKKGTLRGMHFQAAPFEEAKIVRCSRGAIYDVLLDLRPQSKTRKQWAAFELTEENGRMLYIPEGVAHGFQTLVDGTEVFYEMSEYFHPEAARGIRFDDPAFQIVWPVDDKIVSLKDRSYVCFTDA